MQKDILDTSRLPQHIAFIIDGNGRWAKRRGLPRSMGHKSGMIRMKKTVTHAFDLGIHCVSVYCFSTENWNRPKEEVDYLFDLFRQYFEKEFEELFARGVRLQVMGDLSKIPLDVQQSLRAAIERTKDNDKYVLNLAINYGGRNEIVRACNMAIDKGNHVDIPAFEKLLYTKDLPPLDLIIRSSGELRLSNFMLWQAAYAEFYFSNIMWPDFDDKQLDKALIDFQHRNRRFGAIKES